MSATPRSNAGTPIRVLIVDDSAFMRHALRRALSEDQGFEVVGTATDGANAVRLAVSLRPDVITMDVEMPVMDGISAVREIMGVLPTPIVMVSTLTHAGAEATLAALEAGAVEYVPKGSNTGEHMATLTPLLIAAVQRASHSRPRRTPRLAPARESSAPSRRSGGAAAHDRLVVIGSSTGGPSALTEVVPRLPGDLGVPFVVVQHMPAVFTGPLARRLDGLSAVTVREAVDGDALEPNTVLVAPGDYHMVITAGRRVHLTQTAPMHGVRPAVDVTLTSAAEHIGKGVTAVILTGMGRDGAAGACLVEQAGGSVIVQDEATCVIYGMPRAAMETTKHGRAVPLERVAAAITEQIHSGASR